MGSLKLLSYNTRGLASRHRRVSARLLLESLRAQPDVLCLQEHKLRDGRISRIASEVWTRARWLCAPAAEGLHAIRNPGVVAGRGGVALGITHNLVQFIHSEGISACNRAVWICLVHPRWGRLGLLGIYGPNDSAARAELWRSLFFELDSSFLWVTLGDFNMLESPSDQLGGTEGRLAGREAGAWAQLARKLQLRDTFTPRRGHLRFSMRLHRHNPATLRAMWFEATGL